MGDLINRTEKIKAWFEAQALPYITKKQYHPDIKAIEQFGPGVMIITWDRASPGTLTFAQNDTAELTALLDAVVPPGKGLEFADGLLDALRTTPHMWHAVLSAELVEIDFNNPANGGEGLSAKLVFRW